MTVEFKERIKDLPSDFYFDNKEHFFYGCKGIIKDLNIINPNAVAPTLTNFCYTLYDFTIKNLDKINERKLKYPTEVYSFGLRFAKDAESLLVALKNIETIITDYENMIFMSFEEIEKSQFKKYLEPKRFNKEQEKERKKSKLKAIIASTFSWSGYHIDSDKLTNKLINLVDVSGVYRLYNNNDELIYIGKSYNLAARIPMSLKEKKACAFDYSIINNKADTDIYEIYYISKFQPVFNEASNTGDIPTIILPELEFSNIEMVYKENKNNISIEKRFDHIEADILFKTQEELNYIINDISKNYNITRTSKIKENEYCKDSDEYTLTLRLTEKKE